MRYYTGAVYFSFPSFYSRGTIMYLYFGNAQFAAGHAYGIGGFRYAQALAVRGLCTNCEKQQGSECSYSHDV